MPQCGDCSLKTTHPLPCPPPFARRAPLPTGRARPEAWREEAAAAVLLVAMLVAAAALVMAVVVAVVVA